MSIINNVSNDPWGTEPLQEVSEKPDDQQEQDGDNDHLFGYYDFLFGALANDKKKDYAGALAYFEGVAYIVFNIADKEQKTHLITLCPDIESSISRLDFETAGALQAFIETGILEAPSSSQSTPEELLGVGLIAVDMEKAMGSR